MSAKIDLSGLLNFSEKLQQIQNDVPQINAEFIEEEYQQYLKAVIPIVAAEAYDTGDMLNSFISSEVRQSGNETEQDWQNLAPYASFNNYGFTHYLSGQKIPPVYWNERAINQQQEEQERRYHNKLIEKFEGSGE